MNENDQIDQPFNTYMIAGQAAGCLSFWMWAFAGPFNIFINFVIGLILGLIHYYGRLVSLDYLHDRAKFYVTRVLTYMAGITVTLGIHFLFFMTFSQNPSGTFIFSIGIALWWAFWIAVFGDYRLARQSRKKKRKFGID
jgi:hypothetical protein